jgi:tetratricopeptide (TPR) repeat protein
LPPSLESYNELFTREPSEAIKRLENQFRKREYDPVCAILLAWFYKGVGDSATASDYAVKAKLFAPGSPSLAFSPYHLDHPEHFDANLPLDAYSGELPGFFVDRTLSLDELIERLSSGDSGKITLQETRVTQSMDADSPVEERSDNHVFATETLAKIYESQGELEKAAQVYELLLERSPDKAGEYSLKVEALRSGNETSG